MDQFQTSISFVEELGKKNRKEVETQMQFNAANDKSLQRMTKKDNETEATLESKFKLQRKTIMFCYR